MANKTDKKAAPKRRFVEAKLMGYYGGVQRIPGTAKAKFWLKDGENDFSKRWMKDAEPTDEPDADADASISDADAEKAVTEAVQKATVELTAANEQAATDLRAVEAERDALKSKLDDVAAERDGLKDRLKAAEDAAKATKKPDEAPKGNGGGS